MKFNKHDKRIIISLEKAIISYNGFLKVSPGKTFHRKIAFLISRETNLLIEEDLNW
jgi:hypothetical protein